MAFFSLYQHFKPLGCFLAPKSRFRHLEHIVTAFFALVPIIIGILVIQLRKFSGPLFQSMNNNEWIQGWIHACRYQAVQINPDPGNPSTVNQSFAFNGTGVHEDGFCTTFLRCVLFQATDDYPSYWSSSANILAFIPTIVALLSNSIEEIVTISYESHMLALFLALSSTSTFNSRFTNPEQSPIFEHQDGYVVAAHRSVLIRVQKILHHNRENNERKWYMNEKFHMHVATLALIICAGGIWFSVWTLTRYGCVVWSCSSRVHVSLWVALSQALVVLNIAFRSSVFRTEQITLRILNNQREGTTTPEPKPPHPRQRHVPTPERQERPLDGPARHLIIILRCHRRGWERWIVQIISSIISFALYTFSTVALAGMALIWPNNAVYIMAIFSVAGGAGRLVGYWASSALRLGKTVISFDIPETHIDNLRERLENEASWQDLDVELAER